ERMKRCRASGRRGGDPATPANGNRSGSSAIRRNGVHRFAAGGIDACLCASINLLHTRHRLNPDESGREMARYVAECERLTRQECYATAYPHNLARTL